MRKIHMGAWAELVVAQELYNQGWDVYRSMGVHAPFDLVAYKERKFLRVQVKYKSVDKTGSITVHFRSCWADKNGTHMQPVDKGEVDIYCVYCPTTDECYYFNPAEFKRSVTLRVRMPKNNQSKNIKLATDYKRVP